MSLVAVTEYLTEGTQEGKGLFGSQLKVTVYHGRESTTAGGHCVLHQETSSPREMSAQTPSPIPPLNLGKDPQI